MASETLIFLCRIFMVELLELALIGCSLHLQNIPIYIHMHMNIYQLCCIIVAYIYILIYIFIKRLRNDKKYSHVLASLV